MASVRKRTYKDGSSKWIVDFNDDRGKRTLKTFEKKSTAVAFRDRVVTEVEGGHYLSKAQTVTWLVALTAWTEHTRKRVARGEITNGTYAAYECDVTRVTPYFAKMRVSDITTAKVQDMIDDMVPRLSPNTIQHTVNLLGGVFDFVIEGGHLRHNPVNHKKLMLPRRGQKPTIPPKDALRAILIAIRSGRAPGEHVMAYANRAAIITLSLFGTMRRGEVVGLKWKDVDLVRGMIRIERSISYHDGVKAPKTRAGVRSFAMAAPIADALVALRELRKGVNVGPDDFVLLTSKGRPLNPTTVYGDYWRPTLIKAGIITKDEPTPYRFHSLRHAAASLLIAQGASPMHVKTMMGHSSVQMTIDTYGHLFPTDETLRLASERAAHELCATETRLALTSA